MAIFTAGVFGVDMDQLDLGILGSGTYGGGFGAAFTIQAGGHVDTFTGSGLQYAASGAPTAGLLTGVQDTLGGQLVYGLDGVSVDVATFFGWVATGANATAKITLLAGADSVQGSAVSDVLRGYGGDDTIQGGAGSDALDGGQGNDAVYGGLGNDVITDPDGSNYLRGDVGDDILVGGAGFDDINGNMGNDTASGGPGDDWVVGGKDNDSLSGDEGNDIVYGNLGSDTLSGGNGADTLRGGQADDILSGGAGNDWLSGDLGSDTITGGSGADIFHSFGPAGLDLVTDFSLAEGDRVQLDPGTTYTFGQVGADTVINMSGGAQMVLVGVAASSLTAGWIFVA